MGRREPFGHEAVKLREAIEFHLSRVAAYRTSIKALEKLIAEEERVVALKSEKLQTVISEAKTGAK